MESCKILLLAVGSAVVYGILQDQVTARVCVEYFTVAHPPIFNTDDPTLLAFGWGILATWWVGVLLGVPLALAARLGPRPKLTARELCRPIGVLVACVALAALVAGVAGYAFFASLPAKPLAFEHWPASISASRAPLFVAALFAHNMAYLAGFVGGLVVIVRTWRERGRRAGRHEDGGSGRSPGER